MLTHFLASLLVIMLCLIVASDPSQHDARKDLICIVIAEATFVYFLITLVRRKKKAIFG